MKLLLTALVLVFGTATVSVPVSAWPYIDVTASETLSLDPPRYRTTFELSFVGYGNPYQMFFVSPLEQTATHLYECTAAPPWSCNVYATTSGEAFYSIDGDPAPHLPASFSIVTDRIEPCVHFAFLSPLLAKGASRTVIDD